MKTKTSGPLAIAALALTMICSPCLEAQVDATSWTSADGTTIWARLDGWDGNCLTLAMRGKRFRVPLSRLAPRSVEKARQMLNLPEDQMHVAAPDTDVALRENKSSEIALPDFAAPDSPVDENDGMVLPKLGDVPAPASGSRIELTGRHAMPPGGLPDLITTVIDAGNRLQTKPYKWGGGRASLEDTGYDCSGSVSYVLIKAGLLGAPLTSGSFTRYGAPGPGKWITIHARNGHVFMSICGLQLDTGGRGGRGESGPRWNIHPRSTAGFVMRHPVGF